MLGVPLTLGAAALAIRLVWEQTFLSWDRGPQMVGFSLMHGGLGVLLLVLSAAASLWLVGMLVCMLVRRSTGGVPGLAVTCVCAVSLAAILIPYGWWQIAFASKLAHGPHAAEFLSMSSARGHERVVDVLLAKGVQINARTHEGSTALHAAAGSGQMSLVWLLTERGADINAVNRYGDSPLAQAESNNQSEVVEFLRGQGAKLIRGTDEQRERVVREIVREHSAE